ncbi:MAG: hypothetical protein WD512_08240, partial [Candidatus Paceibacterota bacterium]
RETLLGNIFILLFRSNFFSWSIFAIFIFPNLSYSQNDIFIDTLFLQPKFISGHNIQKIKVSVEEFAPNSNSSYNKEYAKWEVVSDLFQNTSNIDSFYNEFQSKDFYINKYHYYLYFDTLGYPLYDSMIGSVKTSIKSQIRKDKPLPIVFTKYIDLNSDKLNLLFYNIKFGNSTPTGRAIPIPPTNEINQSKKVKLIVRLKGEADPKSRTLSVCDSIVEYFFEEKLIQEEHYACSYKNGLIYFKQYLYDENGRLVYENKLKPTSTGQFGYNYVYSEDELIEIRVCTGSKLRNCSRNQLLEYDSKGSLKRKLNMGTASHSGDLYIPALYHISYEYIRN